MLQRFLAYLFNCSAAYLLRPLKKKKNKKTLKNEWIYLICEHLKGNCCGLTKGTQLIF